MTGNMVQMNAGLGHSIGRALMSKQGLSRTWKHCTRLCACDAWRAGSLMVRLSQGLTVLYDLLRIHGLFLWERSCISCEGFSLYAPSVLEHRLWQNPAAWR